MQALSGSIFALSGLITLLFPPKKINSFYGYRTASSMKNQEQWDFAQRYSSKLIILLGTILALCSFLGFIINISEQLELFLGFTALILTVLLLLYFTEKAIKAKFK